MLAVPKTRCHETDGTGFPGWSQFRCRWCKRTYVTEQDGTCIERVISLPAFNGAKVDAKTSKTP